MSYKDGKYCGNLRNTSTNSHPQWNLHGCGKLRYKNGDTYMGEFKHNQRFGYGQYMSKKVLRVYTGQWLDNKRTGFGKLCKYWQWPPNEENIHTIFIGHFKADQFHGEGKLIIFGHYDPDIGDYFPTSSYTGEWKHGKRMKTEFKRSVKLIFFSNQC